MKDTALYRRYRPGTFDEMAGQEHVVKILKNQIQTGNIAHAYLFCGTRGTGKTSAARIFAKGVNCLSQGEKPCGVCENCVSIQNGTFFDVIEIDAASNNGVDNIRELRESVKYPPAAGLCKVYIIDEVHMLSQGAFNALLKTLEEPPAHVIFILATTEPHKLPATILSRCLRLDFRRVAEREVCDKMREICRDLGVSCEESALSLIASAGDGSVRDSLSILEQCIASGEKELTRKNVVEVLGTAGEEVFIEITNMVAQGSASDALLLIHRISEEGKDLRQFTKDWIFHFRNLMMSKFAGKLDAVMNMSCENAEKVKAQGAVLSQAFISRAISELSRISNQMRWSTQPRTWIELSVFKLSSPDLDDSTECLLQRIETLEQKIEQFQAAVPVSPEAVQLPPWESPAETEAAAFGSEPAVVKEPSPSLPSKTEANRAFVNQAESVSQEPESAGEKEKDPVGTDRGTSSFAPSEKIAENTATVLQQDGDPEAVRIWEAVFGKAVLEKPSLNLLRGKIRGLAVKETVFQAEAASEVMRRFAEQNRAYLEGLLKEQIKKEMRLELLLPGSPPSQPEKGKTTAEATIAALEKLVDPGKLTIQD